MTARADSPTASRCGDTTMASVVAYETAARVNERKAATVSRPA
jgi:hypothetical protein